MCAQGRLKSACASTQSYQKKKKQKKNFVSLAVKTETSEGLI